VRRVIDGEDARIDREYNFKEREVHLVNNVSANRNNLYPNKHRPTAASWV